MKINFELLGVKKASQIRTVDQFAKPSQDQILKGRLAESQRLVAGLRRDLDAAMAALMASNKEVDRLNEEIESLRKELQKFQLRSKSAKKQKKDAEIPALSSDQQ